MKTFSSSNESTIYPNLWNAIKSGKVINSKFLHLKYIYISDAKS